MCQALQVIVGGYTMSKPSEEWGTSVRPWVAVPHKNIDAVVCGAAAVMALQTVVSRLTDPLHSAAGPHTSCLFADSTLRCLSPVVSEPTDVIVIPLHDSKMLSWIQTTRVRALGWGAVRDHLPRRGRAVQLHPGLEAVHPTLAFRHFQALSALEI